MFTGIIEQTGSILDFVRNGESARMTVGTPLASRLRLGDSIAVNGVCLTAVATTADSFAADLLRETLQRTTLGSFVRGRRVNLELPTPAGAPLGGHIVQGHIDGTATLVSLEQESGSHNTWRLALRLPVSLMRYMAEKGSVTVDGISLTVAAVAQDTIEISIIPHTYEVTSISSLRPGDSVNIETDALAKYAESLQRRAPSALTLSSLLERGY